MSTEQTPDMLKSRAELIAERDALRKFAQWVAEEWSGGSSIPVREAARAALAARPSQPDLRDANPIGLTPPQKELQRQQLARPSQPD